MSIFNNNRKSLINKKSISKYLLYGIGEITLVVIGILIAININNFKEKKASENKLKTYLKVYKQDLEIDTLIIGQALKYVGDRKQYFQMFLSDTVSQSSYATNPQGYGITLSYFPFNLQQKGIGLLENYINDTEIEQDSVITDLLASHRILENFVNTSIDKISSDIDNNMLYLKENEPWVADLLQGKLNDPQLMSYYLSKKYKARLAVHSGLIYGNLEPQLKNLLNFHKQTISKLDERLKKK